MHVMRSSPCTGHTLLSDIDNSLRHTLSNITNVNITDEQLRQANLFVKAEGIGVRSVDHISCTVSILIIVNKHSTTASSTPR